MDTPISFLTRSAASLGRLKDIAVILAKYGFGEILDVLRLPFKSPAAPESAEAAEATAWTKIRMAFEDLGPTFVKIGQILALRPDLIPLDLCDELKLLQEQVRREPFEVVRQAVERTYGRPLEEVFSSFDTEPVASASLSQVHRAVLADNGREVAVKVRRPGAAATIEADLDIMATLASIVHERVASLQNVNLPQVVVEVRKSLRREIDFVSEARHIIIFRRLFANDDAVTAPRVEEEWTRPQVLVMEFLRGTRLEDYQGDEEERDRIARAGLRCVVSQMLEHGFFHADPHPGNVRILPDGRLCYFDWGMVGRLNDEMRQALVDYIIGIVKGDARRIARTALEMAERVPPLLDMHRFVTDILWVLDKLRAPVGRGPDFGRFLLDMAQTCAGHGIRLRSDYILMGRALVSTEACGRIVKPDFDTLAALKPMGLAYVARRASILFSDKPLFGDVQESLRQLAGLPGKAAHVLEMVEAGQVSITLRQAGVEQQMANLRGLAYVIAAGLVAASLVIGSSLIYISGIGPSWNDTPIFGLTGFTISGLFGMWLVVHLLKRKK
ncbi:AarF/ABC1/UbiB kinase family protein [Desulfovibrio sp. X2]|uniref:ABC1 kinase family protein n=1 Tax=Desulfovibrio sp. X2 TaxID=941449 RepID=UPI000424AB12|nr:AarF/UbiB family protein [Desulfovibrio sp. X2]